MLSSPCWFNDDRTKTGEKFVKKGVWQLVHLAFTSTVHGDPNGRFGPLPPLLQGNFNLPPVLFRRELEGGKESSGAVGDGADIENTSFSVRRQLNAFLAFGLLAKPLRHLIDVDSPLGWNAALAREVQSEISGRHGAGFGVGLRPEMISSTNAGIEIVMTPKMTPIMTM